MSSEQDGATAPYPWDLQPPILYVEGHSHRKGYAVSVEYRHAPPVRFYQNLRKATKIIDRFNRMQRLKWSKRK